MYLQSEAQCNYIKTAPYLANNIIVSGGLGSGGGYNSNYNERVAENKYGYENNTDKQKSVKNNFLENAKKKGN